MTSFLFFKCTLKVVCILGQAYLCVGREGIELVEKQLAGRHSHHGASAFLLWGILVIWKIQWDKGVSLACQGKAQGGLEANVKLPLVLNWE